MIRASDSKARGQWFDPHSGHRVVSLSKTHLLTKSTSNTQEAVVLSRHDLKIVYRDFKQKRNEKYALFKISITYLANIHISHTILVRSKTCIKT